ncbi:hypothetical protein R3Q06_17865 [Rhodococcus erythropolis]|nr:hypothetical protein [Rhodococcus erythropolis]MDV6275364.1 hypothetical protein [Rhodococcus erythropolis]
MTTNHSRRLVSHRTPIRHRRTRPARHPHRLLDVRVARRDLAARFDQALAEYPAGPILTSLPGVGVRTGVTMLVEITDIGRSATQGRSRFTPGSHLAHIAPERPSKVSIDNTAATPRPKTS